MTTIDEQLAQARALEQDGQTEEAGRRYRQIYRHAYGNGPAKLAMMRLAKSLFAEGLAVRDAGDARRAIATLVRSLELNPDSGEVKEETARMLANHVPGRDMTSECLIFPDAQRAERFYGDAIQTALDFVVYGGVIGDILEFGVLAGWTARLFAERMRALQFFGDLHLYDSFAGLPRGKVPIDQQSYDVERGIWQQEMELPPSLIAELGQPIEAHIAERLSLVIDAGRIHVHKGFFSDTLKTPIKAKAAIVHLDCDLYQSTIEVLDALHRDDVLQDGTVLMFDDWNCNRGNPAFGQRRALSEFLAGNASRYAVSQFFGYGFNCNAFILHDLRVAPKVAQ